MYRYQTIKQSEISSLFINKFVDVNLFNEFAKTNTGAYVYSFDFIKGKQIVSYHDVIEKIAQRSDTRFYIMWNLSQRYSKAGELEKADYQLAAIDKVDLIDMLIDQKEDMNGDELCYMKNKSRVVFWDMFIFNRAMTWCYAITHEDNLDGSRLCFYSKPEGTK